MTRLCCWKGGFMGRWRVISVPIVLKSSAYQGRRIGLPYPTGLERLDGWEVWYKGFEMSSKGGGHADSKGIFG